MNLLHAIRRRTRTAIGDACDASYQRGHHEGWQAGWNAAQATHPTSGASIGPSYGPDDRLVTSATVGSGGGQTHSGGNGGSDQGVPAGTAAKAYIDRIQHAAGRCHGITKTGDPCQLPVTPGTNTCHHHRHRHEPPPPKRPNPGAHDRHP